MSKTRMLWMAGVLVWAGVSAADASAFTARYDQKITHGRQIYQSKVAMKDTNFRMESTIQGQVSIVIHNDEGTFTVMPKDGIAMKTPLQPGQGGIEGADNYAEYLKKQHAEQTGSESVNGHACDIYHFTSETGEATTAWVAKDLQFPVKMEIESSEGKMLVDITNVQVGVPVPDSEFKLPPGVQLMDMNNPDRVRLREALLRRGWRP